MKKIAILTAGGIGSRMGQDVPKQFLTVNNKPIIIYTMEAFQNHPEIDAIIVVCLKGWHDILKSYAKQFNITKLASVVAGGKDGQASIKNGLLEAEKLFSADDIVIIHDGNRPCLSADIISQNLAICQQYGNATTAIPCPEVVLTCTNGKTADTLIDRDTIKRTQTPHSFILKDILSAHHEIEQRGLRTAASCAMYQILGRTVYFSPGSEKNIKLTTPDDIDIFNALLHTERETWLK